MIIAEAISTRQIEAGTFCLMMKDEKYYRITIMHLECNGNWIVEGDYNGPLEKERPLFRLSVLTDNNTFPIGFKDWKRIIQANLVGTNGHSFTIKPQKFKPGKNVRNCSECHCTFLATKSQSYCKTCCHKLAIAYIYGNSKQKSEEKKYSRTFVEQVAGEAYDMSCINVAPIDFTLWLKSKLDGNNSDTEKDL